MRAESERTDRRPDDGRGESPDQRHDRNWNELLQELRVLQTGVQVLAGFMLTVPFQQRFPELSTGERAGYAITLSLVLLAVALLVAPVAIHRVLFRQRLKKETVEQGDRLAKSGIVCLGASLVGAFHLVLSASTGAPASIIGPVVLAAVFLTLWLALPLVTRRGTEVRRRPG